jgi:NitT/TauT family transport system substrate-binding protein
VAEHIETRFGTINRSLAAAIRHGLEVSIFYPVLGPLNEVHGRLLAAGTTMGLADRLAEPPSQRWSELMTNVFGGDEVGLRREPVGNGRDALAERHRAVLASHVPTPRDRDVAHQLLLTARAFVIAEAMRLGDIVDDWRHSGVLQDPEGNPAADLLPALLGTGDVGARLARIAADETWYRLLSDVADSPFADVPFVPTQRVDDAPAQVPVRSAAPRAAGWWTGLTTHPRVLFPLACLVFVALILAPALQRSQAGVLGAPPVPEKRHVKVVIMNTTDLGPFLYALDQKYFTKAGFRFDPSTDVKKVDSGTEAVRLLESGEVDFAYATYVPFIIAQREHHNIKLVAGASSAGPGSCMVVAMPRGKVRGIQDMPGKRVAITARNTMSDLLIMSALRSNGVDPSSIEWVPARFEDMAGMLRSGTVDAAFMTEPYMTDAKTSVGALPVFDTAVGPTLTLPTAAFGTTARFARDNPGAVEAFRGVLEKATTEVNEDKDKVGGPLLFHVNIKTRPEMLPQLLTYVSALDESRLADVVGLMREFGMLDKDVDVFPMIARRF